MFTILDSINENVNSIKLGMHQAYSLLLIFSSPTPELALEYINSSEKLINATAYLKRMQLIKYNPAGYTINNMGEKVLSYNGFIDDKGNLTQKGKALLNTKNSEIK
jgi:hypothetical protein